MKAHAHITRLLSLSVSARRLVTILLMLLNVSAAFAGDMRPRFYDGAATLPFAPYNTRVGSQGFESTFTFPPPATRLEQQAHHTMQMGSDAFKFVLNASHYSDMANPSVLPQVRNLVDIIELFPAFKAVLDMPFSYLCIWVYPVASPEVNFRDGLSTTERQLEYQQMYGLARYLLQRYQGTGRSFLLGHWEGDWTLLGAYDPNATPTATAIQGMIDWYNTRQQAVEDARASLPNIQNVFVYHYAECNLVQKSIEHPNDPTYYTVSNGVLPHVTVDLVSYSAYEALNPYTLLPQRAQTHFDFITANSNFTSAWPFDRKVIVGEFGYGWNGDKIEQDRRNTLGLRAAAQWGCPLILYWTTYAAAGAPELSLFKSDGSPTQEYGTLRHLLGDTIAQRDIVRIHLHRNPSISEQNALMDAFEASTPMTLLADIYDNAQFTAVRDDYVFLATVYRKLLMSDGIDGQAFQQQLNELTAHVRDRWQTMVHLVDSVEFAAAVSDAQFVDYLFEGTLARISGTTTANEVTTLLTRLGSGTPRSELWIEALESEEFRNRGLELRSADVLSDQTYRRYVLDFRPNAGRSPVTLWPAYD